MDDCFLLGEVLAATNIMTRGANHFRHGPVQVVQRYVDQDAACDGQIKESIFERQIEDAAGHDIQTGTAALSNAARIVVWLDTPEFDVRPEDLCNRNQIVPAVAPNFQNAAQRQATDDRLPAWDKRFPVDLVSVCVGATEFAAPSVELWCRILTHTLLPNLPRFHSPFTVDQRVVRQLIAHSGVMEPLHSPTLRNSCCPMPGQWSSQARATGSGHESLPARNADATLRTASITSSTSSSLMP